MELLNKFPLPHLTHRHRALACQLHQTLALILKIPSLSFFLAGYRTTEELKADTSVAYSQAYDSSASSNVDSTVPTSVLESVPGTTGRETTTVVASSTDVSFYCSRITNSFWLMIPHTSSLWLMVMKRTFPFIDRKML